MQLNILFLGDHISCIEINSALLHGCILFIYLFLSHQPRCFTDKWYQRDQQFDAVQYCICVYFPANMAAISKGRHKNK